MKMTDLFAGIGVASLAADFVFGGVEHEFVEINPYSQTILKKHFPNATIHGDIKTYSPTGTVDIVWGSPPCQAASQAGKRKGTADDRWLWPDTFRVIREAKPRWWVLENVRGLLTLNGGLDFEELCLEMEGLGYAIQAFCIPAIALNAPHRRDRIWIIGHSNLHKCNQKNPGSSTEESGQEERVRENNNSTGQLGRTTELLHADWKFNGYEQDVTDSESFDGKWSKPEGNRTGKSQEEIGNIDRNIRDSDYEGLEGHRSDGECARKRTIGETNWEEDWRSVAFRTCIRGVDDGSPRGIHRLIDGTTLTKAGLRTQRLKALGNSLVYPVVVKIFQAIKEAD